LPQPIFFEDFEKAQLGSIPQGWTVTNNTDSINTGNDIGDPKSDAYLNWLVIDRNQVFINGTNEAAVWEANDPDGRVTTIAPGQVVNGKILTAADLMQGKFLYAESDERGGNQVQAAFTPMYDLTGKSNLWVSFHSSYVQNQDNINSLEYSVDGGANWLPILYMVDAPDIVYMADGTTIDAVGTLNADRGDSAYAQPYGTYIAAPITQDLAPYISGRINDDKVESHRVEAFPIPAADNKAKVQFRFMQAGTASWFWGIDDFGIYSIGQTAGGGGAQFGPVIKNADNTLTFSWSGGGTLQSATSVSGPWTDLTSATSPYKAPVTGSALFLRIKQ
jgi:hypothetical protein